MLPIETKLIIDLSLGDGYIGGNDNKGYYFRCSHSIKQREYVEHKSRLFEQLGFNPIIKEKYVENSYGKNFIGFLVYTKYAKSARKYLYNKKIKTLDKALLSVLDRKSLAYWFMDDGCVDHYDKLKTGNKIYHYEIPFARAYRIATCAHTVEEIQLVCDWLYEKYAIVAKPTKQGIYFNLSITTQASKDIFKSIISEFIIPSMQYKIQYPHSLRGIPYKMLEP